MSSNPKYTDLSELRYVVTEYTIEANQNYFNIPSVPGNRRHVILNVTYPTDNTIPLNIRLPGETEPFKNLVVTLVPVNDEQIRLTNIVEERNIVNVIVTLAIVSEGSVNPIVLNFQSNLVGYWIKDYSDDPVNSRLSATSLHLTGTSAYSGVYEIYQSSFNGKPQFMHSSGEWMLRYEWIDGWSVVNRNDNTTEVYAVNNAMAQYPWEVDYDFGLKVYLKYEIPVSNVNGLTGDVWINEGLPAPKVKLVVNTTVNIQTLDTSTGEAGTSPLPIGTLPIVVCQDLTPEQVSSGNVFVEVVTMHKEPGKVSSVPSPYYGTYLPSEADPNQMVWQGHNWIHPWPQTYTSRTGKHAVALPNEVSIPIKIDRPNHFPVTQLNEVIPIYEFFNGRFTFKDIAYRAAGGVITSMNLCIPTGTGKKASLNAESRLGYAAGFCPLRIACRYIVWHPDKQIIVSGPLSPTIKIWYRPFPLHLDHVESTIVGYPVFNPSELGSGLVCTFNT